MTTAFDEFIRQYNLKGSEKADGYSPDVFIGLSESEKQEVFDLLLTEISVSAKWLFLLNPDKALNVVKDKEAQWRGDAYRRVFNLQEEIIQHAGDLTYQNHMIEDYPHYSENLKPLAIDSIGRTPNTLQKITFLKNIILTETNDDAVFRAASRLLNSLKLPRDTDAQEKEYQTLISDLNNSETTIKIQAFQILEYYQMDVKI